MVFSGIMRDMLYLHTSHQLEQLAQQFTQMIQTPLDNIFAPEMVVVQNSGMKRYLSLFVADQAGISANMKGLFPADFMWELLRIVSPHVSKQSECSPDALRFRIMHELCENFSDYPTLHHYILNEDNCVINETRTWDLSCELAQLLDQYLFYRSDWISDWEQGHAPADNWQAKLWQRCVSDNQLSHWLSLQNQFKGAIDQFDTQQLPQRVSFFSLSALSPGYLDLLGELAQKIDVHLYIINPCEDVYWGDIASAKTRSKLDTQEQAYVDVGNPLLASMGKQGRDFLDQLLNLPDASHEAEQAAPQTKNHTNNTLLAQLQQDVLTLQQPEPLTKTSGALDDKQTLIFNACHTVMREVEVLYDQVLDALDNDPDLNPSEIVVMMPDIEKYAPYIDAVFSQNPSESHSQKLPFSIADRNPLSAFQQMEALSKILLLSENRFDVESVFELLDYADIRQQFNLSEAQVLQCRKLAKATNIRWGINAASRQQQQLPDTDEHTWKYALDRILLGYAVGDSPEHGETLFANNKSPHLPLLAYTDIEGSDATMLADFKCFSDTLFALSHWHQQRLTLTDWLNKMRQLINQLWAESNQNIMLSNAISDLKSKVLLSDFKRKINFDVFQKIFKEKLQSITGSEKYLGYGITFCALVPMRSVPFKIVALLGMNDGEYPRQDRHYSFDLMANQARRGDRSRRDEDRYLFLESILAARQRLIISFIGQSVKDNSTLPPSVLVNELLDTLTCYTQRPPQNFICKHPLQAFSPRYFNGSSQLFSYAQQYLALHTDPQKKQDADSSQFITEPLQTLDDSFKHLSLETLIKFFQSPARSFLQQRFSIQTYDEELTLPIREPFELEFLKDREIRQLVACEHPDENQQAALLSRAKGLLPYGEIGDAIFDKERQIVEDFQAWLPDIEEQTTRPFSFTLGEFQLHGELTHIGNSGGIIQQLSAPFFRDYIRLWLNHLVLNNLERSTTTFYSPEISFTLKAIDHAQDSLQKLLALYWQGLHFPLHFFPKSAHTLHKTSFPKNKSAVDAWHGSNQRAGEKEKFEHWLLYRHLEMTEDNLDPEFLNISQLIFGDMYAALEEI